MDAVSDIYDEDNQNSFKKEIEERMEAARYEHIPDLAITPAYLENLVKRHTLGAPFSTSNKSVCTTRADTCATKEDAEYDANNVVLAKDWLPTGRALIELQTREIFELNQRLRSAQINLAVTRKLVEHHESVASVRRHFPHDMLREIMDRRIENVTRNRQWLVCLGLSHVCSLWRDVALSQTCYWSYLTVSPFNVWQSSYGTTRSEWVRTMVERSVDRPLDVSIEVRIDTPAGVLDSVLDVSKRWGRLEIRDYKQFVTLDEENKIHMSQAPLDNLTALMLPGVERPIRPWEEVGEDPHQIVTWIENAKNLRSLSLKDTISPEMCLRAHWETIQHYEEDSCWRRNPMFHSHLSSMKSLVALRLRNVNIPVLTDGQHITLSSVETVNLLMDRASMNPILDPLAIFIFQSLKSLTVRGCWFANAIDIALDESIFVLWRRSKEPAIDSIAIEPCTDCIPSKSSKTIILVRKLTVAGAQGHDIVGRTTHEWSNKLTSVLDFQFSHNLRVVDFRPRRGGTNNLTETETVCLRELQARTKTATVLLPTPESVDTWRHGSMHGGQWEEYGTGWDSNIFDVSWWI
ncbi:hypothetical protein B0H12DRAFT_1073839 [Mycena haematopus]|nr:hypothetical protein B0H12DRAFT_1073839 [Mycena haematopus]